MIAKILCPVDISDIPSNAVEYAARLSQTLEASLTLMNVVPLPVAGGHFEEDTQLGERMLEEQGEAERILRSVAEEVQENFRISCWYEVSDQSMGSLQRIISREAEEESYDLIVMGTKGADDLRSFIFGSNAYKVIKKAECPVLVIPEDVSWEPVSRIVYATDHQPEEHLRVEQLMDWTRKFGARLTILHVSRSEEPISKDAYQAFCNAVSERFGDDPSLYFERVVDEDPPLAIDTYVHKNDVDMLALTTGPHRLIDALFHKSMAKKLSAVADYPMLVFHR